MGLVPLRQLGLWKPSTDLCAPADDTLQAEHAKAARVSGFYLSGFAHSGEAVSVFQMLAGFSFWYFAKKAMPSGSSKISTCTPCCRTFSSLPESFVTSPTTIFWNGSCQINAAQVSQGLQEVNIVVLLKSRRRASLAAEVSP